MIVEQEKVFSVPNEEIVVKIGSITEGWFLTHETVVMWNDENDFVISSAAPRLATHATRVILILSISFKNAFKEKKVKLSS